MRLHPSSCRFICINVSLARRPSAGASLLIYAWLKVRVERLMNFASPFLSSRPWSREPFFIAKWGCGGNVKKQHNKLHFSWHIVRESAEEFAPRLGLFVACVHVSGVLIITINQRSTHFIISLRHEALEWAPCWVWVLTCGWWICISQKPSEGKTGGRRNETHAWGD